MLYNELCGASGSVAQIVASDANSVTKVTTRSYGLDYLRRIEDSLWGYADQLATEPLSAAGLQETSIVEAGDGHYLEHTVERIQGPCLSDLPPDDKIQMARTIVGHIASMETIPGRPNLLHTGIDASAANFHIKDGEPVLIDLLPPLARRGDGAFPTDTLMLPTTSISRRFLPWTFGTKSGAVTKLMSSVVDRGHTTAQKLTGTMRKVDDIWYDVVNQSGLDPTVRGSVRRQLQLRFVPYLAAAITQEHLKLKR